MKNKTRVFLILPALIFFLIFTLWPICEIIKLSFYKTNFIVTKFVFFDNFLLAFENEDFRTSIINSFYYALILVPGHTILGFIGAITIFSLNKKWQDVSKILFYLPVLSSGIIIAQVWKWAFGMEGPINWLLGFIGIEQIAWFSQGNTGIFAVGFIVVLSSFGANVLVILTSLVDIDKGLLESSVIDGANDFQKIFYIIIPSISNTLKLVMFVSAVAAFQIYETIMMLCPYVHTSTMTYQIYNTGFKNSNYGLASVEALLLMIIIIPLLILQNKVKKNA